MKKILKIEGMHCSSCALGVEILLNTKGVKGKVDFNSKKAEIEFDQNKISIEEVKKEIEKAGYKVSWIKIKCLGIKNERI